jgi:hypothetical protein
MNAKETIKAINDCKTVEEVQVLLDTENGLEKPRSTVAKAGADMIESINNPKVDDSTSSEDADAPTEVVLDENPKHQLFYSKIPHGCRGTQIIEGAKSFFGEDFKSGEQEGKKVTIVLKNGEVLLCNGL